MDKEINNIRANIDRIDKDIVSLLEKRMLFVKKIGALKSAKQDISYIKADREYSMMQELSKLTSAIPQDIIFQIWRSIISHSLHNEKKYNIYFCGDESSFNKAYYLIRIYFSYLPNITNVNNKNIEQLNNVVNDPSNILVAGLTDNMFLEFLAQNRGYKIFTELKSEIGENYFAAAKIPVKYLSSMNKLYMSRKKEGSCYTVIHNPEQVNSQDILVGSYS